MGARKGFNELRDCDLIKREIKGLFDVDLNINTRGVKNKGWVYATLDDNQILDNDAKNLAFALEQIDVNILYGAWVFDVFSGSNFDVDVFCADKKSIEMIQRPDSRLDHMDSFIFGCHPLKFLILRPDLSSKGLYLYILGPEIFVLNAAQEKGWNIIK